LALQNKVDDLKKQISVLKDAEKLIGHAVGGVCPFAVNDGVKIYLDKSLKRFETVFPACGSSNSAAKFTCAELEQYAKPVSWADVCKGWREEEKA
ncbi:MAG: hypothetical protein K2K34_04090, partial [Oscillospiraceae bacterium]|nr:hypothetical protein [Oscillospiraceae bacterium]